VLTRSGCATQKLTIQKFYNVMSTWLPTCIVCLRLVDPTSGNVLQLEINLAILQFVSQTLLAYALCNSGLMSTSANLCQLQPTCANFNQLRCHKQTIQKFCNVMSTWPPTCIICLRLHMNLGSCSGCCEYLPQVLVRLLFLFIYYFTNLIDYTFWVSVSFH
jgi:hypothetical protein